MRFAFKHMCLKTQVQLDTDQVAILMLKLTSSLASNISGFMGQHTKEYDRQHNQKPPVVLQIVATKSRTATPKEIIPTQNKREHRFQLTLALHYVNKL